MKPLTSDEMAPIGKFTLTDYLRARTRFIIDPIVSLLVRLPLSPDALTVTGMLAHALFAWLIFNGQFRLAAVAIFVLAPLDALDGALARKLGWQKRPFGAFLDSTLDRVAEIIMFGGFLLYYAQRVDTFMVAVAYLAITGSLMVSYSRARAEALGFDCKVGILSRVERYGVLIVLLALRLPDYAMLIMAGFTYVTVAQRIFHVWQQGRAQRHSEIEPR